MEKEIKQLLKIYNKMIKHYDNRLNDIYDEEAEYDRGAKETYEDVVKDLRKILGMANDKYKNKNV